MPWQNNNGGKDRGPWGSGPGGGGQQPPDIDELIRKGQDKFRKAFGGGGGGRGGSQGGGKSMFFLIGLLVVVGYLYAGFYKVQPDEAGVVLRFGKWIKTEDTGLHFHFPPIDRVYTPKITAVNKIDVGSGKQERQMLTGDENIVDVEYSIFWRISDPARFLFNLEQQEQSIKSVSESAMREVVAKTKVQQIMTSERDGIEIEVRGIMQRVLNSYEAGIEITQVKLDTVSPPVEVREAFNDVQKAEADRDKTINEAKKYQNEIVPTARGEAEQMNQQAEAYKARAVTKAQGESARFLAVYEQYKMAKDVTRRRMYLETMEDILGRTDKVILENDGTGVLPYLPLPNVKKQN
ncbi:FtsH protease activity modulator HflK [Paremcibacter congregatus]|uniref:Protein HflK n=1 Tax=Paremcibacter congregatus TaxID=2043170 RepID=A0A2G4YRJ6_9PROT|nr:FtsH protease activity modulator HflK [Paremcibacter congregatus]PHZ84952.1 FtsH protease activity modulator HflK [Paremcibacter congregatus]QDE26074.1 FtsH protease activity modulator HflK [Paremcibacter congregatus]